MSEPYILVIDDDPMIRRTLHANLAARGYEVAAVETGEEALAEVALRRPDLLILDLLLPGLSGMEVCRTVRATSSVPILVLSAHGEERIKVLALDLGADDYLTKPFSMEELLARVRALLRRHALAPDEAKRLEVGNFVVDLEMRRAWRDGQVLHLTQRELDMLVYLLRHAGRIVSHSRLLTEVWGPEYHDETHYLRVFINRLRHKIEDDPAHPRHLVTVPGVGYRLIPGVATGSDDAP
jgi:two-component system KDP operon response regulator KdpE